MLKHRIITSIVLLPLFLGLLFFLPPVGFCYFTGLIILVGAWEWSFFMGIKQFPFYLFYPFFLLLLMIASLALPIPMVLYGDCGFWLIALAFVLFYPKGNALWGRSKIIRGIIGIFVLIPTWLALNFIRDSEGGIYRLLFLLVIIWGADTAAYFSGKKWGKHKLAPNVSPGKTWEGLIGALICTLFIAAVSLYFLQLPKSIWPGALILTVITVLFSILGDLFESMMKRNAGLKDSSQLLPGHGGVLDRIDGWTSAAPIFAVGAMILSRL